MPDILLELKNIKKSFTPGEDVLDDICLTVARGEFVTLLGSSGCGKTRGGRDHQQAHLQG